MRLRAGLFAILVFTPAASAQTDPAALLARAVQESEAFRQKAQFLVAQEILRQRSFTVPPHPRIAIGAAAEDPLRPRYFVHEIVSEYSIAPLKGGQPPQLVEFREIVSKDSAPIKKRENARRALKQDSQSGEERVRKRILEELTALGLVDVASDYGTVLLAFTKEGLPELELTSGKEGFVGAEEAVSLDWRQNAGGALEFRGHKVSRVPMRGTIWIRKSDRLPLRILCSMEHPEGKHTLRDEATIDYIPSAVGFVVPATVTHRHIVDGQPLTENLYSYEAFHLFTSDTKIEYTTPGAK
jgi:hypothetical protein